MTDRYQNTLFGPHVRAIQDAMGSRHAYAKSDSPTGAPDPLTDAELDFIAARDSFYIATAGADGWPYLQHRGGPAGFVKALSATRIAFADFRGNRQYISLGNIATDSRASLFFMDYPRRARLKLLGRVSALAAAEDPALIAALAHPAYRGHIERALLIDVDAFEWNCSQHITPRYTVDDFAPVVRKLEARIAELEALIASAKGGN